MGFGSQSSYEAKRELLSNDTTKTKYISSGSKLLVKSVQENEGIGQKYFYHTDLVGSIRAITDSFGNIIATYEYGPFGSLLVSPGADNDNIAFGGKRFDSTGLSYFGARYYDAAIGRFISRDPAFDGQNWFVYCKNNPLIYIDPTGLVVEWKYGSSNENQRDAEINMGNSPEIAEELATMYFNNLMEDPNFRAMYEELEASEETYTIMAYFFAGGQGGTGSVYDPSNRTVYWNVFKDEVGIGPDGILNHEISHAVNHNANNLSHRLDEVRNLVENNTLYSMMGEALERLNIIFSREGAYNG